MGLFGNEEKKMAKEQAKADKQAQKEYELLARYGLEGLSNPKDIASVRKIANEMMGTGLMDAGMKLSLAKPEFQLPVSLQRTIVEQNFIMIRQLDELITLLKK